MELSEISCLQQQQQHCLRLAMSALLRCYQQCVIDLEPLVLAMLHCYILNPCSHCLATRLRQKVHAAQAVPSEVVCLQGSANKDSDCNRATFCSSGPLATPSETKALASHDIMSECERAKTGQMNLTQNRVVNTQKATASGTLCAATATIRINSEVTAGIPEASTHCSWFAKRSDSMSCSTGSRSK